MLLLEIAVTPLYYPYAPMLHPSAHWSTGDAPSRYSQKSRYCLLSLRCYYQVLIYVFDVESRELEKDLHYYQSCLEAIIQNSPEVRQ